MVTKTLTYTGKSPRPFGIRIPGYRARFDPATEKTLTLPADHADRLLNIDPDAWSEYVPPAPVVTVAKEKSEVKKAVLDGDHSEGLQS
jgi:hypothetical protein